MTKMLDDFYFGQGFEIEIGVIVFLQTDARDKIITFRFQPPNKWL